MEKNLLKNILGFIARVLILLIISVVSFFSAQPFIDLVNPFYHEAPASIFDFLYSFGGDWLGIILSITLWAGIVYGTLGKKMDYFFISILFLLALWDFLYTKNMTPMILAILFATAIVGNVLGYALKRGRVALEW